MKKEILTHDEPVIIPPEPAFERQYADAPAKDGPEEVIIPPLAEIDREYADVSASLPGDAEVIIPAEAQAQVDREKKELEEEETRMYEDYLNTLPADSPQRKMYEKFKNSQK